jgi:2,4-dienoyl-CoA reductase-like NADH-dependent reductase (Old Yellow Enzyme family)
MITDVAQADEIVIEGDADLVMIGRELLRQPYLALRAQAEIGVKPSWPVQYGYAVQPVGK